MHLTRLATLLIVVSTALSRGIAAPAVAAPPPPTPYAYTVADFPSPAQGYSRLAIDPEYDTLYVSDYDNTGVSLVDTTTGVSRPVDDAVQGYHLAVDTSAHVAYAYGSFTGLTAIDRDGSVRDVSGMGSGIFGLGADSRTHEIYGTDAAHDAVNVVSATGTRVATIPVGDSPWDIAIDDVGRRAYVGNVRGHSVSIIDLDTHVVVATVDMGGVPYSVAVDAVTHRAYVGRDYAAVVVIDGGTNRVVDTIAPPSSVLRLEVDQVSHTAYVGGGPSVAVIDLASGATTSTISTRSDVFDLAVDPVRHTVFAVMDDGSMQQITQLRKQRAIVRELSATTGGTAGGEQVTITGDHFAGATKVTFGGAKATAFTVESDDRIVATVPPHEAGKVPVRVRTAGLSAKSRSSRYTYLAPSSPTK